MVVSRRRMLLLGAPVLGASSVDAELAGSGTAFAETPTAGFVPTEELGIAPSNGAATNPPTSSRRCQTR